MKKRLFFIVCAFALSLASFAQTIPFDEYGNVLLSNYENYADNQTVKIVVSIDNSVVTGPGWGIGTISPINNGEVQQYEFKSQTAGSAEGTENTFNFTIAELKEFAKVNGEYYEDSYGQRGITINLYNGATLVSITVDAAVVPSAILDFESDEIDATYSAIAWNLTDITAKVENDPAGIYGKSLHVTATNYNAYPKVSITLPDGNTIASIEKITFNIYFKAVEDDDSNYPQNKYKSIDYFAGATGTSFTANESTGKVLNLIANETTGSWLNKEFSFTGLTDDLLALNAFDFALGINYNKCDYYLDNITLVTKETSIIMPATVNRSVRPIAGGILIDGNGEKVSVYGIDGRLIKQAVTGNKTIPLEKGLYMVKTGDCKAVKVWVE
jgi:hypothetical protein